MVKVLFANMHLFKYTLPALFYKKLIYDDDRRCKELCSFMKSEDFDVVILAEVWSKKFKRLITKTMKGIFPYSWIPKRKCKIYKISPEFIILSKREINGKCMENLEDLGGWDKFSQKMIGGCTINDIFYVFTHLDANSSKYRNKNLIQVRNFIQRNSGDKKVIVAGDMNINEMISYETIPTLEYTNMIMLLSSCNIMDSCRFIHPNPLIDRDFTTNSDENPTMKHFNANSGVKERIDYFFTRGIVPNALIVNKLFFSIIIQSN
jgi:exonuclease III